jgi:GT2 family glycosyltransferase/glycosyltransferase involved in cell wall biosynthesis
MKSILIITEQFTLGGLETHIQGEIRELTKQGIEVHLAAGSIFDEALLPPCVSTVSPDIPLTPSATAEDLLSAINRIRAIICERKIEAVHIHPFTSIIPGVIAAELEGVPYAITLHGPTSLASYGPIYDFLFKHFIIENAPLLVTVSIEVQKLLLPYASSNAIVHIPNSVSFNEVVNLDSDFKDNDPRWLLVSRLDSLKIPGILDFCIKAHNTEIPGVVIVGDGPAKAALEEVLKINGLNDYVELVGARTDVPRLMRRSSGIAGMGRVLLEGIAAQKPTILIGYDGVKGIVDAQMLMDIANNNFSGRDFPTINLASFSEQIKFKLNLKNTSEIYQIAKEKYNDNISWHLFTKILSKVRTNKSSPITSFYYLLKASPTKEDKPYLLSWDLIDQLTRLVSSKNYYNARLFSLLILCRERFDNEANKNILIKNISQMADLQYTVMERDQKILELTNKTHELSQWGSGLQASLAESEKQVNELINKSHELSQWGSSLRASQAEREKQLAGIQQALDAKHIELMTMSDWAYGMMQEINFRNKSVYIRMIEQIKTIRLHNFKNSSKKIALKIARHTLHAMPVSNATKNRLSDTFFRTLQTLRRYSTPKTLKVQTAVDVSIPSEQWSAINSKRDVFVFAVIDWHFRIQRPQHIARSLAERGHRVFYFSNHFLDVEEPGYEIEKLPGTNTLLQVKLHVPGAPAIYYDPPSDDSLTALKKSIAKFIQDFGALSSISILQHPYWYPLAKVLPNSYHIYDCMDHHEGFGNVPAKLVEIEKEMLRSADLVTVTSSWLEDFARKHNPSVAVVRNAGEYTHFEKKPEKTYKDAMGRKIIGYYGAIAEWFDVDLVRAIALGHPECLILLVGNDTVDAQKTLSDLGNVEFTGEVPYATLPFYLHAFDVCLLPFKVIPLTLATNPVKVYEYLAAGKPVVCVDLPEVGQFAKFVSRACSTPDFVALVGAALENSGVLVEKKSVERRHFASEQTWSHRGAELAAALNAVRMPRISVIILTFNNLELTKACIDSVLKRSDYPNLEVIVVDNASSDDTPAYLDELTQHNPDVRIILNQENLGFAAGNNVGLSIATGDYLVLLNNDTVVTQGWIVTLLRHFKANPNLGLLGPVTNNIGNEARIKTSYIDINQMPSEIIQYTLFRMGERYPMRNAAFFCVMLSRSTYEQCGPISEEYGRGFFEDDDYCRQVESKGLLIACAEDVFVHHHLSASFNKLKNSERQKLFDRNKAIYEKKWGTWVSHTYRKN